MTLSLQNLANPASLPPSIPLVGAVNRNVKCESLTDLSSVSHLNCFHENVKSASVMGLAIWWPAMRMRTAGCVLKQGLLM